MNLPTATALVAEDEPVLARGLVRTLSRLWPALRVPAIVHDGLAAIEAAALHRPDIVFLDIRMPECNGLDAAERIVDDWPDEQPLPLIVFVTAFDRFAVEAFERAAVDYVLKPVEPERLALSCERLRQRLAERAAWGGGRAATTGTAAPPLHTAQALHALHTLRDAPPAEPPLTLIQAAQGSTLHVVPVSDVLYFEADDKYVRVVTPARALLIRTPLRELLPRLDRREFIQVHRGAVVRLALIERVVREDTGRIWLYLKGRTERLAVSRSHAHLFKPM